MVSFLTELAQARPDPGGGAAAAYGARLGLALLEKVVQLEYERRQKPGSLPGEKWEEALAQLHRLAVNLAKLQKEDIQAYFNLTVARTSDDPAQLTAAVREAVDCPKRIMHQAAEALELLAWVGQRCKKHLVSDLLVAGEFLGAAFKGAFHIAQANLPLIPEAKRCRALAGELCQARREGEELYQKVQAALTAREAGNAGCRG